jgi:hypothetical protein
MMIHSAIKYASRGMYIFPVQAGAKVPLTEHGVKDASTDPQQIERWWEQYPDANIGLACGEASGVIALDFDTKHGKPGLRTLADIESRFNIETLTATTPSNGVHWLFRYPGSMLKNNVELLPGLDIRTTGGYVLIAPSVVAGKPYRWTRIIQPAEMPSGLIALLQKPTPTPRQAQPRVWTSTRLQLIERARRYVSATPGAVEGNAGDISTYKLTCRLVRGFGLTDGEALMLLSSWNQRCWPAWSERELIAKITSARRNGTEPIGGRLEAVSR